MRITPFTIAIPDAALVELRGRLAHTRWPGQPEDIDWEQGTNLDYLQSLADYWRNGFNWRAQEAALNQLPQFHAEVGEQRIHFVHQRARRGRGLPLILTHGWPGSFAEMVKIVPMLTDPEAHGGAAGDAFDVIVPSLPGYAFSPPPRRTGMNAFAIAALWAELMAGLGYERFAVQGGDWGASVSTGLGFRFPDRIVGLHLNYIPGSFEPAYDPAGGDLTDEERTFLAERAAWAEAEGAYGHLQATRPQTLAYALDDSPAGLAAWIVEKFRAWSDCGGELERAITRDELLVNLSIYWFTRTAGSSLRLYWEVRRRPLRFAPGERIRVPCAVARFAQEAPFPPRSWAERVYNVRRWTSFPVGGHFAALEQPALLAEDIRAFFRPLRRP